MIYREKPYDGRSNHFRSHGKADAERGQYREYPKNVLHGVLDSPAEPGLKDVYFATGLRMMA